MNEGISAMITVTCDNCGKEIDPEGGQKIALANNNYLYYYLGDNEGEEDEKDLCPDCIIAMLLEVAGPPKETVN